MNFLVTSVLVGAVAGAPPAEPPEIATYYRDYNLATAFSTRAERSRLIESAAAPDSERLRRVARWLKRLDGMVADHDPGIARDARGSTLLAYRADLLRVTSVETDDEAGVATVELEAVSIEPTGGALFVSRYDELAGGGKEPSVERLLAEVRGRTTVSLERHRWERRGGRWRLAPATHHFLK
jgi:hypothetical protein